MRSTSIFAVAASLLSYTLIASAQTFTSCNPLTSNACPADPALGKSVTIDFTQGASESFSAVGNPTYNSNGAGFTVAAEGDAPTITSKWYIMFGHVEYVVQAAPGTGIVSSCVLQSDDLDEIDWEWLGGDDTQVQSNYFGKGQTTTYNRGAYHPAPGNHDGFHTYTIDWTSEQIVWQIDGTTVRALTVADADDQYPQSPMMIKVGVWAGGDPSNPPGTIAWAGGDTNYAAGPFTMYLKSIAVTDYSTGTSYSYQGTSGTWESIQAAGGSVNGNSGGAVAEASSAAASAPAITSVSNPPAFGSGTYGGKSQSNFVTPSVYPWVPDPTATLVTATASVTTYPGLPSGWTVTNSGKVLPPSAAATTSPATSSPSAVSLVSPSGGGLEVVTSYDQQGFPTLVTIDPAAPTVAKSYDSQGFLITSAPVASTTAAPQAVDSASTSASQLVVMASKTNQGALSNRVAGAMAAVCAFIGGIMVL